MLKHGDVLQIKLMPFYKDGIYFGKVIDYAYQFDAYKYNLFIHVFNRLEDVNKGPDFLFTNPIQIRLENINLNFEKRISIISHEAVKDYEYVDNLIFRDECSNMISDLNPTFSIYDLRLGLYSFEFEYSLSKTKNLEFLGYHTLFTIVNRIVIEKLISESRSITIFESIIPKTLYKELNSLYNLYEGKIPYQKQLKAKKNYFEVDWALVLNSRYKCKNFEKKLYEVNPKYIIYFSFRYEFSIYDPLFQKFGFRAISYTWAALVYKILDSFLKDIQGLDLKKIKIDILDNSRFSFDFVAKGERDLFYDIVQREIGSLSKVEKWLKKLKDDKDVQELIFYKHPSLEDDYIELENEEINVEALNSENVYLDFYKYTVKRNLITFGLQLNITSFAVILERHNLDIYINGEEFDEIIRPEIKKILGLKKTTFEVDDATESLTYVFKKEEQFKIVKKYLLSLFSSDRKVKAWLIENFLN